MMKNCHRVFLVTLSIFVFAYLLNFVWESFHSFSLYQGHNIESGKYVLMINYMSIMDAVTILGIYLTIAFFEKDILWLEQLTKKRILMIIIFGLITAILAEYRAVYLTKEWSYNAFMPVVFGIGVSPMIQLSITGWLAIWVTSRLFYPAIGRINYKNPD